LLRKIKFIPGIAWKKIAFCGQIKEFLNIENSKLVTTFIHANKLLFAFTVILKKNVELLMRYTPVEEKRRKEIFS
jgi:hypothetical protein